MVLMDRNQRQGAVAEMRVALALVEHGCAVNSMTQMDFGTDLTVQVPRRIPDAEDETWEMTQQTANLQIKSSRSAGENAVVPYTVAAEWADFHRRTSPTFLILSVRDDYFAFDTARIRGLADRSLARRRRKLHKDYAWSEELGDPPGLEETTVSFSAKNGLRVSREALPGLIVYWTLNAAELDALARIDPELPAGLEAGATDAVLRFAGLLVGAYATAFYDYEEFLHASHGGSEETFGLARDVVRVALGDRGADADATTVVSSIPITPTGWGVTPALHHFTAETDPQRAHDALVGLTRRLTER